MLMTSEQNKHILFQIHLFQSKAIFVLFGALITMWPSMNSSSLKTAKNLRMNITKKRHKKPDALFHSQWKGITYLLFNNGRHIS